MKKPKRLRTFGPRYVPIEVDLEDVYDPDKIITTTDLGIVRVGPYVRTLRGWTRLRTEAGVLKWKEDHLCIDVWHPLHGEMLVHRCIKVHSVRRVTPRGIERLSDAEVQDAGKLKPFTPEVESLTMVSNRPKELERRLPEQSPNADRE